MDDSAIMNVPQHLESEQINYEFPPKSHLKALAFLDQTEEEYSFFDESSFTTLSNDSFLVDTDASYFSSLTDEKETLEHTHSHHVPLPPLDDLSHPSPLQLPAQAHHQIDQRHPTSACDPSMTKSPGLITPRSILYKNSSPSSFGHAHLSPPVSSIDAPYDATHPYLYEVDDDDTDLPIVVHEAEPMLDSDDEDDSDSFSSLDLPQQVVLIKLNKPRPSSPRSATSLTYLTYPQCRDDDEIESASVFLPMESQANNAPTPASTSSTIMTMMQQQNDRIAALERQVKEERAMRQAFETAMEEMTVLIDQQQKMLYDRLDQEISMRQTYEKKMHHALQQVQPLEDRIHQESQSRQVLEQSMLCLLEKVDALQHKPSSPSPSSSPHQPNNNKAPSQGLPITRQPPRPSATPVKIKPASITSSHNRNPPNKKRPTLTPASTRSASRHSDILSSALASSSSSSKKQRSPGSSRPWSLRR
ncbi:hypothetical protein DM01DRAFT_1384901 [Hesseltinella vesiculosa]|uniref:Uncharacterized protein n=1 Tax=Hesseltinella vesiculosa TaxID=101127 RepID=A0A1X2GBX9_9FUNG|nr:hypothetical protein DM01DRAFT_1384901 [Hesseltinella vesiculosa]